MFKLAIRTGKDRRNFDAYYYIKEANMKDCLVYDSNKIKAKEQSSGSHLS